MPEARGRVRVISRRALLAGGLAAGCARAPGAAAPRLRHFARELPRETALGAPFDPTQLEGRVLLINFFATWCFPCIADLVTQQKLERDFGPRGLSVVLVGMDLEGARVLQPFAEGYRLTAPVIVADDRLRSGETLFGRIRELPSRLLFARDGALVVGFSGVTKYEDLERLVASEVSKP